MKTIILERDTIRKIGHCRPNPTFVAANYSAHYSPRLCAGSTARIFNLGPDAQKIKAIFTKKPPKKSGKYYVIGMCSSVYYLEGFRGNFLPGVYTTLGDMYKLGYRYVWVERIK